MKRRVISATLTSNPLIELAPKPEKRVLGERKEAKKDGNGELRTATKPALKESKAGESVINFEKELAS